MATKLLKLFVAACICFCTISDKPKLLLRQLNRSDEHPPAEEIERACALTDLRSFGILLGISKLSARLFKRMWSYRLKRVAKKKFNSFKLQTWHTNYCDIRARVADFSIEYDNREYSVQKLAVSDSTTLNATIKYGGNMTLRFILKAEIIPTYDLLKKGVQVMKWMLRKESSQSIFLDIPVKIELEQPWLDISVAAEILRCKPKIKNCERQGVLSTIYLAARRRFGKLTGRILRRFRHLKILEISLEHKSKSVLARWDEISTSSYVDTAWYNLMKRTLPDTRIAEVLNDAPHLMMKRVNALIAKSLRSRGQATCLRVKNTLT